MTTKRKDGESIVKYYIQKGYSPSQIIQSKILTKDVTYKAVAKLKKKGLKMISPGVWQFAKTHHEGMPHTPIKEVRGHGITATLRVNKLRNWHNRDKLMRKAGIKFETIPQGQKIIIDKVNIWLTKKSVVFYLPYSWFGRDAQECHDKAMTYLLALINEVEKKLRVATFKINGFYNVKFTRQHYALIRNALAKQYNKEHKKLRVYDNNGLWLEIDNSLNLNELETYRTPDVNKLVQDSFNDIKEGITPRFLMERINDVTENQEHFAKNMKSHIAAIQELATGVRELRSAIKELKKNGNKD